MADLNGVLEDVLPVTGTVMEAAQHFDQFRVKLADTALEYCPLSLGLDGCLYLPPGFLHHLLNVGGVDAPVRNQPFQGNPGNLPAHRLKAGDGNGLRRVVNNQIHAGEGFNGADVASFPPNDASFHLIVGQGNHADRHFRHLVRRAPLDGLGDDLSGPGFALLFHPGLNLFNLHGGFMCHLGLHLGNQILLGLFHGKAGDFFQHIRLLFFQGFNFLPRLVNRRVLLCQGFLPFLDGLQLPVNVVLLLLQTVFLSLQVGPAFLHFFFVFAPVLLNLLIGFQQGFAHPGFRPLVGIVLNGPCAFLRLAHGVLFHGQAVANPEEEADRAADAHSNQEGYQPRPRHSCVSSCSFASRLSHVGRLLIGFRLGTG